MDADKQLEHDVNELWALVFRLVLDGEKLLTAQLADHGLTPPQFYVLKTLSEHGGHSPIGQIARLHGLTNATMTGLVKRLEAFDPPLVERMTNRDDRRSVNVVMTSAGMDRFIAVQADLMAQLRVVLSLIPAEDRASILHDLRRYVSLITATFPVENSPE
ncbi:MAG TPA: MarR family transcriptional regulator [Phototrophicaceae bacterium]|nr:MarR family transcriptional regulator [Phototrophicaceae bacterium]